jgi:hypothetical protein
MMMMVMVMVMVMMMPVCCPGTAARPSLGFDLTMASASVIEYTTYRLKGTHAQAAFTGSQHQRLACCIASVRPVSPFRDRTVGCADHMSAQWQGERRDGIH